MKTYQHLRVFPLPEMVLFPHTMLPLHVFEPRYRQMTRDVLASDKLMMVPMLLEEERPGRPSPRFAPVAGVGEVVLAHELPDGRYNIVLRGCARVRVDEELPSGTAYRVVAATELPDDPLATGGEAADAQASLRALVSGLVHFLPEGGELLEQMVAAQQTAAELVDVLSAALVSDAQVRQGLLETTDILLRMSRVSTEVALLKGRLRPGAPTN